jgi:exodeoxyribonuclease V alpha subunit
VNLAATSTVIGTEQALVKVLDIRSQNKFGVIFRGQRIKPNGELLDTHNELIVKAIYRDLAVSVMLGQWWNVKGKVERRRFINNLGFEMTEDQMTVERGGASMVMPSGAHIVDYLTRNPRFHGVGRITAERLWEAFGETLFGILDSGDTKGLERVVMPQKAATLADGWREEGLSNSLQWLQAHGIPLKIGRRILGYFGSEADAKITENPYRLLSFSAGWREVDAIARDKLRIKDDDSRRLVAAIEETVYRRFSLGHTYVPRSDLFAGLRSILAGEDHGNPLIETAIEHSRATGRLLFDRAGNACSLGASILENTVVDGIRLRIGRKSAPGLVDQIIYSYEGQQGHGFKLNKEQREAVHLIAENDFAVVTGGAGCGKTTVLKCVHEVLSDHGYDVTQLALAGKAVKRMMEATGKPAMTLASFIKEMRQREAKNEKVSGELIEPRKMALVIDESSMVDLISFSSVLRLIDDNTKIVLIGDPHQLPPVGPGLILHCLTAVPGIPHVELKVAKRFGNDIADIANAVKDGSFPALNQFNSAVRFIEAGANEMEELGSSLYLKQPQDSVVLCATRKVAGQINLKVQASLTKGNKPLRLFNIEVDMWEHTGFHEGDLLICTRNHWDLGVQNGSLGRLIEVFDDPLRLDSDGEGEPPALGWIEWDDGEKSPLREDLLDSLELGYALTVHKSQGSQWKRVIVCFPCPPHIQSSLIERSMIYTAITRAQTEVTICGEHAYLVNAVGLEKAADRRKIGLPKRLDRAGLVLGVV